MNYKRTLRRMKEFLEHVDHANYDEIAFDMAVCCSEALSKKIPEKPIRDKLDKANLCPICNNPFTLWRGNQIFENKPNYCSSCGQAIDWNN